MDTNVCIVTGPIGSGKTYVCEMLKNYGFRVLNLDIISNELLNSQEGLNFLSKNFPNVLSNKKIQKKLLAEEVFTDRAKLLILEKYIHPKINEYVNTWTKNLSGYGFIEVSAPKHNFREHRIIVLNAPIELRRERLLDRGMDPEDIDRRIRVQEPEEWWNALGVNMKNINSVDIKKDVTSLLIKWGWLNE